MPCSPDSRMVVGVRIVIDVAGNGDRQRGLLEREDRAGRIDRPGDRAGRNVSVRRVVIVRRQRQARAGELAVVKIDEHVGTGGFGVMRGGEFRRHGRAFELVALGHGVGA